MSCQNGLNSIVNTSVAVGTASTQVLAGNSKRKYALLVNDSNEAMYLGIGQAAVTNKGIPLAIGAAYEISGVNLITTPVYAMCASGAKNLCVVEGSLI